MNIQIKHIIRLTAKTILWLILTLFLLFIVAAMLLYTPPIQKIILSKGLALAEKSTGLEIKTTNLNLSFPLDISIAEATINESSGATEIEAHDIYVSARLLPLLRMRIVLDSVAVSQVRYHMLSADSSMTLDADVKHCTITGSSILLNDNNINIGNGHIADGKVSVYINTDVESEKSDTTATAPWNITAEKITLDRIKYAMSMRPTIDTLSVNINTATLINGVVDTGAHTVDADALTIDGLDATYFTQQSTPANDKTEDVTVEKISTPWTVRCNSIDLTNSAGEYGISGAPATSSGLDFNHIVISDLGFHIDSLYNRGTTLDLPITYMHAREQCGLQVDSLSGTFHMDTTTIALRDFALTTSHSHIALDADADASIINMDNNAQLSLVASACISPTDIIDIYPSCRQAITAIGTSHPITLSADISGTLANLLVNNFGISIPAIASLTATGTVDNIFNNKTRNGDINITGTASNLNRLKSLFVDKSTARMFNIPHLKLQGDVGFSGNSYSTDMQVNVEGGTMLINGNIDIDSEDYTVAIGTRAVPLNRIVPDSRLGSISADLEMSGSGFNPLSGNAYTDATLNINNIEYNGHQIDSIKATANIADGYGCVMIASETKPIDFVAQINSTLINNRYDYALDLKLNNIDFKALGLSETALQLSTEAAATGVININDNYYNTDAVITNLSATIDDKTLHSNQVDIDIEADSCATRIDVTERDMDIRFQASASLDSLLQQLNKMSACLNSGIANKRLQIDSLITTLPQMDGNFSFGRNNIIADYLNQSGININAFNMTIDNDTTLRLDADISRLHTSDITVDTITFKAHQVGESLLYDIHLGNAPGNLDQFATTNLTGGVSSDSITMQMHQKNRQGITGFQLGIAGVYTDDAFHISMFPYNPIIGYRTWNLNSDNFIEYDTQHGHIDANVDLKSDAGYVSFITQHENDSIQEDMILKAEGINLAEWLNVSPFMPKVAGVLNANANINRDGNMLNGTGSLGLSGLAFNRKDLGSIDIDMSLGVDTVTQRNSATARVLLNGVETITASGYIGTRHDRIAVDSASMTPDYNVIIKRFPLSYVNPFIPQGMISLSGYISGNASMTKSGDISEINGTLMCDSTLLRIPAFGSRLEFGSQPITIDKSNVLVNNFDIIGTNKNVAEINGNIDITQMSNPYVNLRLAGENIQIIDSKYTSKSQLFGKAFININGNATGRFSALNCRTFIDILPKTDVSYVMQDDVSTLNQSSTENLVQFVNFTDTTTVVASEKEKENFNLNLDAVINIREGSTMNVNISTDGKNKVQVGSSGTLTYSMAGTSNSRLTGRLNINSGFLRYYPPFISEKYFTFTPGSYISFNGDMLNPTLSLYATGNQSATVVTSGTNPSRVNFEISAAVTNTLNNMNVEFGLSALNNSLIEAELQSMSAQQRSAQAINLMLYGTYTSGQLSSTAMSTNSNMLYSVLSSQLNNLASKVVKGVDISFGINQYSSDTNADTGNGISYSYSVSKSLFDNRFKMTIGGNYDTGETSDISVAQNLFSNVSFEYLLNQSGTMSLQLYNKVTDNNIYQTQVNETGFAFTLRRKLSSLKNLFNNVTTRFGRFSTSKKKENESSEK